MQKLTSEVSLKVQATALLFKYVKDVLYYPHSLFISFNEFVDSQFNKYNL